MTAPAASATPKFLLHAVFEPKEVMNNLPREYIFRKFTNKTPPDGLSCFGTGQGHGLNIQYLTEKMRIDRNKGKDCGKYMKSAFLWFDEESFLKHGFVEEEDLKDLGLTRFFEIVPDPQADSPTHTLVRLPEGMKWDADDGQSEEKEVSKTFGCNGLKAGRALNIRLKVTLREYFSNKCIYLSEIQEVWLSDCGRLAAGACGNDRQTMDCGALMAGQNLLNQATQAAWRTED